MLIRCAGGDGNMLLNVGPMPSGEIAPEQVGRLQEMGAWLAKYGESIYGTRGGPFRPGRFGVSTRKGRTIYLHVATLARRDAGAAGHSGQNRPRHRSDRRRRHHQADRSRHRGLLCRPATGSRLTRSLRWNWIARPARFAPLAASNVSHSLAAGKKATASNAYRNMAEFGPAKAFDDNSETRWATDSGTKSAWLEVDLGKPVAIGRGVIEQAFPELQRVRKFAIEYWQDGRWQACYRGENLGATLEATFPPITAQRVRLNISEATDGPTIWEFELYPPPK